MKKAYETGNLVELFLVRHGESAGNVARTHAEKNGLAQIAYQHRDMDIPLSDLGLRQANATGSWFAAQKNSLANPLIISSPYVRAHQTAIELCQQMNIPADQICLDERLREREFGAIDHLTHRGIVESFPKEAESYASLGKFYYRPPGGENWCDVILRLRSFLRTLESEYASEWVIVVCHSVVVMCFRYILEQMTEGQILKIDRETDLANASVTSYQFNPLSLKRFNFVAPIEASGEKVTDLPDGTGPAKT